MKVRKSKMSDYEELMVLFNGFVEEDRYSGHDNDSFTKVMNNPNNHVYVVEDKGQLIGFSSFSIRDVIRYPRPIAELDSIFVLEDYRRSGVGKILMDKCLEVAKELSCYRMYIETGHKKKSAHRFYENLGFTNYGLHFVINL